jgi:thiol-disulfide isomerase/thioredoxin
MKTYYKIHVTILLFFGGAGTCISQEQNPVDKLKLGDSIPDISLREFVNDKERVSSLRALSNNKLLIIDLWATWCGPCVGMFPKMDSLEKKFGGKMKFLSVTKESKQKVDQFLKGMKAINGLSPLTVVNDKSIHELFNFSTIPFYAWIDKSGKLMGTSSQDEITDKNIQNALENRFTFINRTDTSKKIFDESQIFKLYENAVLSTDNQPVESIPSNNIISYSAATGYLTNAPGKFMFNMDHFAAINISVWLLYRYYYELAYYETPKRGAFASSNRHIFEFTNPEVLNKLSLREGLSSSPTIEEIAKWGKANGVCYEIVYPQNMSWKEKMKLVKDDLDRYFAQRIGFSTHIEKRTDNTTYALKSFKDASNSKASASFQRHNHFQYIQQAEPLIKFLNVLKSTYFQSKAINFTDENLPEGKFDLELNCDMTNLKSINKALYRYGFKFEQAITVNDVLVFTDKK